jgi:ubiquinone/menaquinone biosynthesis C-methylase UbiE
MTEHETRRKNVKENDDHNRELDRIVIEYARREREIDPEMYAFWQRDVLFTEANRKRVAVQLLKDLAVLPSKRSRCLEVGFGNGGWISTFLSWGLRQENISGIELLKERADTARAIFPSADLRTGDAAVLPWDNESFDLVFISTVFSSILDVRLRRTIAHEIKRVLKVGGCVICYDFRVKNPNNCHLRKVSKQELHSMFPGFEGHMKSVTLALPIARLVLRFSWILASLLEALPFLRTHFVAVLRKA